MNFAVLCAIMIFFAFCWTMVVALAGEFFFFTHFTWHLTSAKTIAYIFWFFMVQCTSMLHTCSPGPTLNTSSHKLLCSQAIIKIVNYTNFFADVPMYLGTFKGVFRAATMFMVEILKVQLFWSVTCSCFAFMSIGNLGFAFVCWCRVSDSSSFRPPRVCNPT